MSGRIQLNGAERAAFPHDCDQRHRAHEAGIKKVTKISLTTSANRPLCRLCMELRTGNSNQRHGEIVCAAVIADNVNSVHQAASSVCVHAAPSPHLAAAMRRAVFGVAACAF